MIIQFLRFYFSRTTKNGVALRKSIKSAMPRPKPRPPLVIPESIRRQA